MDFENTPLSSNESTGMIGQVNVSKQEPTVLPKTITPNDRRAMINRVAALSVNTEASKETA